MKKMHILFYLSLVLATTIDANTIRVPADQSKIQDAINAASNGDTILVSPGRYFENINFKEKNVVLTSYYILNQDTSFISNTIIDGSMPVSLDTASCILILQGQDSTTVVQGFTITGGQGTSWKDEHSSGTYREGGGLLVALSSPVIQYNLIINNEATNNTGFDGAGGGGMRCGDGSPIIENNVIVNNNGKYGGGIVLNWCGAVLRNNIIAGNEGGQEYGGGGIWINNTNGTTNTIENNTIINNHSTKPGGGILMYSSEAKATLKNNIIYGNTAPSSPQITSGSAVTVSYCDIEGSWTGTGNINILPMFTDTLLYLNSSSPCVDAGDPNSIYNDSPDIIIPSNALFPSMGGLRNDIGAYGGPGAHIFPYFRFSGIRLMTTMLSLGNTNVVDIPVERKLMLVNQSTDLRSIDSVVVTTNKDVLKVNYFPVNLLQPSQSDSIKIEWTPANDQQFIDTLLVYHNALNSVNPLKVIVSGKAANLSSVHNSLSEESIQNSPNPFSDYTVISYAVNHPASLVIYNISGEVIKKYSELNGSGSVRFDGSSLPSGIYIYKLITQDELEISNKMVILK